MEAWNKKPQSMLSDTKPAETDAELRERAERVVDQTLPLSPLPLETMSLEAVRQALHELQVHQIELEMQNEELQRAQVQLDKAKSRYFDLYDMAPVGYCTVNPAGVVKEANIAAATLLGTTRSQLVGKWLSHYVTKPHQDRFYLHRKLVVVDDEPQVCELQMVKTDGSLCWVAMTTTMALEDDGSCVHRVVLHDITDAKTLLQHQLLSPRSHTDTAATTAAAPRRMSVENPPRNALHMHAKNARPTDMVLQTARREPSNPATVPGLVA